jgi:hypothetical protein
VFLKGWNSFFQKWHTRNAQGTENQCKSNRQKRSLG